MGDPGMTEEPRTLEELPIEELLSTLREESTELIATLDGVIQGIGQKLSPEDLHDLERLKVLVQEISHKTE